MIRDLIARGIGFLDGEKFLPTLGLDTGSPPPPLLGDQSMFDMVARNSSPTLMFFIDHAGATTVDVSKNGGAFNASANLPTDLGNGWYSLSLSVGESDTLGPLAFQFANGVQANHLFQVVAQLPGILDTNQVNATTLDFTAAQKILETHTVAESYAADGSNFSVSKALYMIWSALSQFAIAGTSLECKAINGTTNVMGFTLDDATNPTSRTRSS
jgi:hypothetical protein